MDALREIATEEAFEAAWPLLALSLGEGAEGRRSALAARYLHTPGHRLWALAGAAGPVAVVGLRRSGEAGEILHIAVAPKHRRAGIGAALVRWLCRTWPGVRSWRAETDDDAVGFYRRLGFAVVDLGERYPGRRRYACVLRVAATAGPSAGEDKPATDAGTDAVLAYSPCMDTEEQAGLGAQSADAVRAVIRHVVATIAYRTRKCLVGAPPGFARFDAGGGARTPADLVDHLTGLCHFACGLLAGSPRRELEPVGWEAGIERLGAALRELDTAVAEAGSWHQDPAMALHGPLSDALTHVGQLAMLRRLAGSPIQGENYARAPIRIGQVSLDGDANPA